MVGTGLAAERAEVEVDRLLRESTFLEIGRDALGLPSYSTPEMLAIEREVVATAQSLAVRSWRAVHPDDRASRCKTAGLSAEQTEAAFAAAAGTAIAIVEGAPGAGASLSNDRCVLMSTGLMNKQIAAETNLVRSP
jgi:hypothetical protein